MLNYLGDLGIDKCLSDKDVMGQFFNIYKSNYLNKVLDLESAINHKKENQKDFFDNYYKLFIKGLVQYKVLMEKARESIGVKEEVVISSWLFSLNLYTDKYTTQSEIQKTKDFLSYLACNTKAEKITDDVMEQLKKAQEGRLVLMENRKKKKKKIDVVEMILDSKIIKFAVWSDNNYFINKLQNSLNISDEAIIKVTDLAIQNTIKDSSKGVTYKDDLLSYVKSNTISNFILEKSKTNDSIKKINDIGLFSLSEKEDVLSFVKENINLDNKFIKVNNIDITYRESITIAYVVNAYIAEKLLDSHIKKKHLLLDVGQSLLNLGFSPEVSNWEELCKKLKENILPEVKDFHYQAHKKNIDLSDGLNEWLSSFHLNETLAKNNKISIKVKI